MTSIPFALARAARKICSACLAEKAVDQFYSDPRRKGGLRARCIVCYRVGLKSSRTKRTPAQRADYRRRKLGITVEYLNREEISRRAATRRQASVAHKQERKTAMDIQKAATQERQRAKDRARYHSLDIETKRMKHRVARHRKRLLRQDQADGTLGREGFETLFSAAQTCFYCAVELTRFSGLRWAKTDATLDHVIPISKGGRHGLSNAVIACAGCNFSRRNTDLMIWASRQGSEVLGRAVLAVHRAAVSS